MLLLSYDNAVAADKQRKGWLLFYGFFSTVERRIVDRLPGWTEEDLKIQTMPVVTVCV